jgi:hypothetical protein
MLDSGSKSAASTNTRMARLAEEGLSEIATAIMRTWGSNRSVGTGARS